MKLRDLLRYSLQSVRAYLLKEDFDQFWDNVSATWAGKFLDEWCRQTMRSQIERLSPLILNYCKAKKQFSSGVVEGLNDKVKVTMRKSHGFRTFRITEMALDHSLGKLPQRIGSLGREPGSRCAFAGLAINTPTSGKTAMFCVGRW